MPEPISRSRKQLSEITHLAPVKQGIVVRPGKPPVTYADRLKITLEAFHRREDQGFPSVIRLFEGIHVAQWALLDGDTRLLLNVTFDGDWYDYLRALVYDVPAFLHLIWSNCEGWEPVDDNPEALFSFIKAYQARVSFFYAQHPAFTVQDIDRMARIADGASTHPEFSSATLLADAELAKPLSFGERRLRALAAFDVASNGLANAKAAFIGLFQSLYTPGEFARAYTESFGELPPLSASGTGGAEVPSGAGGAELKGAGR